MSVANILSLLRRLSPKVASTDKLVKHIFAQCCNKGLPTVDFIVDNFDRSGGMGKYWNYSNAFAPNGNGADIIGGTLQVTDLNSYNTHYGPSGVYKIIEPITGYIGLYQGYTGVSLIPAGVATYQAVLRGPFTAELGFTVPASASNKAVAVLLALAGGRRTVGGLYSALGSRAGYNTLNVSGNGGSITEAFVDYDTWAITPTGAISGSMFIKATANNDGMLSIGTGLPTTILASVFDLPSGQLNYFKAWANGVTPPNQSGHGVVQDGEYVWLDKYHSNGEYNPLA